MFKRLTHMNNMSSASAFGAEASFACPQTMNISEIIMDAIILASIIVFRLYSLLAEGIIRKLFTKFNTIVEPLGVN